MVRGIETRFDSQTIFLKVNSQIMDFFPKRESIRESRPTQVVQLWCSLSKTRGVASLFRYGVCLSRAKGHQAVTDTRVPPTAFPSPPSKVSQVWFSGQRPTPENQTTSVCLSSATSFDVLNRGSRFAAIRIVTGLQQFQIARCETSKAPSIHRRSQLNHLHLKAILDCSAHIVG